MIRTYGGYETPEQFAKSGADNNPSYSYDRLLASARKWLAKKRQGVRCEDCGGEIWASGSAIGDDAQCFPCITGSNLSHEDFELR